MPTIGQQLAYRIRTPVWASLPEIRAARSAIRAGTRRPGKDLLRFDRALERAEARRARAVSRSRR